MASIESHNIQPPYLLVNKFSELTYTLMDFSEIYRNKEKHATLVMIPLPQVKEQAGNLKIFIS
jgi:hypothetical protein